MSNLTEVIKLQLSELEACYEVINQAEDLLGVALAHLCGDEGYANKQAVIQYLEAYFAAKRNRRAAAYQQQPSTEKL